MTGRKKKNENSRRKNNELNQKWGKIKKKEKKNTSQTGEKQ